LIDITTPNDQVMIYFSGHGTSRRDIINRWPLPYGTGAFFPVDYDADGSMQQRVEGLLIGRTDLKPLLAQLDHKGTTTLVLMDTCFSGNAARSILPANVPLAKRFVSLNRRGDSSNSDDSHMPIPPAQPSIYPYQNVMFLAASAEWEYASDITWANLPRFPTHDNKPHGAFSDALIRVMTGDINGDSNHDGALSYDELYRGIRLFMEQRQYPQSPQSFPLATENNQLRHRILLAGHSEINIADDSLKVQLIIEDKRLIKQLQNEPQIRVVDQAPDFIINKQADHWVISTVGGDHVGQFNLDQSRLMIARLRQEAWVRHFVYAKNSQQRFNLQLDLFGDASGGTAVAGDNVGISVLSEQDAYLVIFNVNTKGHVNILYPYNKQEYNQKITANQAFKIAGNNKNDMIVVHPPFGVEYIVGIAFKQQPNTLLPLLRKVITEHDREDLQTIQRLISTPSANWAKANLRMVSLAKQDLMAQPDADQNQQQAMALHDKALVTNDIRVKIDLLTRAIRSYPLFKSHDELGQSYWQQQNYKDALAQFEYALSLTQNDKQKEALALGRIAQVKLQLYEYHEAEQHLDVARSLISDMPPWMKTLDQQLEQAFSTEIVSAQQIKNILQKKNYAVVRRIPLRVGFNFNKASLNDKGIIQANQITKALRDLPKTQHIKLIGHTDLRGRPQYNMKLSTQRAKAVQNYLLNQLPDYQQRLCVHGEGLKRPIRRGNSKADHAINRRVEVQAVDAC